MNNSVNKTTQEKTQYKVDFGEMLSNYGVYIAFLVMCVLLSVLSEHFLTLSNFLNLIQHISYNGIIAIGMTFVIISGGIDLSVGSILALTGIVSGRLATTEGTIYLAILIGLGVAILCGATSGFLVAKVKVAPFIATLAMMTIARGLALVLSNGRPVIGLPDKYLYIGHGSVFGIPISIIIFIAIILMASFILHFTKFGRYVYAVGGNEVAARASGLDVTKIKLIVYIISSICAGIAGIVLSSRVSAASPIAGEGYELDAIAAVVIGGASLTGGVGNILGTVVGALIIGTLSNGLDLLNVSAYYKQIIKGVIIIAAVVNSIRSSSE